MNLKTYLTAERGRAKWLAEQLPGVSASYLSQMANGTAPISPQRCVLIEQLTMGVVGRKDLHPDDWQSIWPELDAAVQRGASDSHPDTAPPEDPGPSRNNLMQLGLAAPPVILDRPQ